MNIKHGFYGTKLYGLRKDILKRCYQKSAKNYKYYGGRGIKVCKEWFENPKSFFDWAIRNGYKDGLEIDRIDFDGNYEPSNCHFITHRENTSVGKRRIFKNNKTGVSGICKNKIGKYELYCTISGKQKYIGVFENIEQAIFKKNEIIGNIHDNHELLK